MDAHRRLLRIGMMAGLGSGFCWAVNNLLFSHGFTVMSGVSSVLLLPLFCAAINDSCAAVSLLLVNGAKGLLGSFFRAIHSRSGRVICLAALIGGPVGQLAYYYGIAYAGATYALMITALYPVIGCVLAWFFLKQRITLRMWLGILLSGLGAVLLTYDGSMNAIQADFSLGIIAALLAACCWASEIVLAVYAMSDLSASMAITIRECISGGTLLLMTVLFFPLVELGSLLTDAFMGLFSLACAGVLAGLSYLLFYLANKTVGCARGTATNATYLVWGLLLSMFFGTGTEVTLRVIIGCAGVLLGVLLVSINTEEESDG